MRNTLTVLMSQITTRADSRDLLDHWIWAVPVILIVAVLSFRQIDLYPPTTDEYYSMFNVGWIVYSPYSPIDVLESLQSNSANHTPFYFLLLNLWGYLVETDVAMGRTLTIFTAMLSLAMTYRLTRDFVAPVAGIFALVIVASNAFYNYYIPHARMYPLLLFVSGLVLWLYLRIMIQYKAVKMRDYLALACACYVLVNVHAFSALFFSAIGLYHLLLAPKNRRWIRVSLAVVAALLLFSPWIPVLISKGIDRSFNRLEPGTAGVRDILEAWFGATFNGTPLLLLVSLCGIVIGWRKKLISLQPYLLIFMFFLLALVLTAVVTAAVPVSNMRLTLPGWQPLLLFLVAGLFGLYRLRKWLGLLVLLWLLAGVSFQMTADWRGHMAGRVKTFPSPPWHAISRLVQRSSSPAPLIGYRFYGSIFYSSTNVNYPQSEYYFGKHGLVVKAIGELDVFQDYTRRLAITEPSIMEFHRKSSLTSTEASDLESILAESNYEPCEVEEVGVDTVWVQYMWKQLECAPPQLTASYETDQLEYEFYGARIDASDDQLLFVDKWAARSDLVPAHYNLSHQLISVDWERVASLDLPAGARRQPATILDRYQRCTGGQLPSDGDPLRQSDGRTLQLDRQPRRSSLHTRADRSGHTGIATNGERTCRPMLVPISWLRDYVEFDIPVELLAERLTVAGLEVAHLKYTGVPQQTVPGVQMPSSDHLVWDREKLLLGRIAEVKAHPNADRLVLAMVDYGGAKLEQCVTGATNLFRYKDQGEISPPIWSAFATEGATVWDGQSDKPRRMVLKGKELRGIHNKSMVCSEKRIGHLR